MSNVEHFKEVFNGSSDRPSAALREKIAALDIDEMGESEVDHVVGSTVTELRAGLIETGRFVQVSDMEELAAYLADDEGTTVAAALKRLTDNVSTGFTAESTGIVYLLPSASLAHDEIHETVHVCSAPGGTTRIHTEYGESLNEGFTEYFTKRMCAELGVDDADKYPSEFGFAMRLARAVGHPAMHRAYLADGGLDEIVGLLAERWAALAASTAWSARSFNAAYPLPESDAATRDEVATKLRAHMFRDDDPDVKFWVALFR